MREDIGQIEMDIENRRTRAIKWLNLQIGFQCLVITGLLSVCVLIWLGIL